MPMVVASAYDENKNIVPLYVAVDGDDFPYQPESPGLTVNLNDDRLGVTLTATSLNPTGGFFEMSGNGIVYTGSNNSEWQSIDVKFVNNTPFTLILSVDFSISIDTGTAGRHELEKNDSYEFPYMFNLNKNTEVSYPLLNHKRVTLSSSGSVGAYEAFPLISVSR